MTRKTRAERDLKVARVRLDVRPSTKAAWMAAAQERGLSLTAWLELAAEVYLFVTAQDGMDGVDIDAVHYRQLSSAPPCAHSGALPPVPALDAAGGDFLP
jgi:hypothetical protein